MARLDAWTNPNVGEDDTLPIRVSNGNMICICGYELLKQDENTYRCSGGAHSYHLDEGDIVVLTDGSLAFRRRR